jgi:hypothetical protein
MVEIENVLTRLSKIFANTDLNYVIVGGIAVIHYGHIRATQDINIIIEDIPSKYPRLLNLLEKYEFDVMKNQFYLAYQEKTNISVFDNKSFLRLDIKIAHTKREKEVLNNTIKKKIFGKNYYIWVILRVFRTRNY